MSTANFHNINASKIFAVEIEEEFDYDDLKFNLFNELKLDEGGTDRGELRSYGSNVVGSLRRRDITITIIVRSAYFSGVNLDWQIDYAGNYESLENYEDFSDDVKDDEELTESEKSDMLTKAQIDVKFLINKVETVFELFSTPLVCVGRASNGEAFYKKA